MGGRACAYGQLFSCPASALLSCFSAAAVVSSAGLEQPVNRDAANAAAITAVSNVFLFIIVPPLFRPRALICILRFLSRLRSVLPDPLIALS